MPNRTCLNCGKPFQVPYPSSKRVNCSEKCRIARLRKPDRKTRADKGTRKTKWAKLGCAECGKEFEVAPWRARSAAKHGSSLYCSKSCAAMRRRRRFKDGPLRGQKAIGRPAGRGRYTDPEGYVRIYLAPEDRPPGQPKKSYHGEHRVVMAQELGRWPEPHETVHHINGDKQDNRPENLQLRSGRHGKGGVLRCRACGSRDIEHVQL